MERGGKRWRSRDMTRERKRLCCVEGYLLDLLLLLLSQGWTRSFSCINQHLSHWRTWGNKTSGLQAFVYFTLSISTWNTLQTFLFPEARKELVPV
eukprot:1392907-Amorphochlora_amoeboformis.AAC.2